MSSVKQLIEELEELRTERLLLLMYMKALKRGNPERNDQAVKKLRERINKKEELIRRYEDRIRAMTRKGR